MRHSAAAPRIRGAGGKRSDAPEMNLKARLALRAFLILLILAAAGFAVRWGAQDRLIPILDWVASLGAWGASLFVLIYVLACVLFLPGTILTLGAGAIFGVLKGAILVLISATLGAACAFLIGRHLARGRVARRIEGHPQFEAIDAAVGREGWKIVLLTRLSPVVPFNLLNYAYGLTGIPLRHYALASLVGMTPGTVLYVYLGSLAGEIARLGGDRARTPGEWALLGAGLAATAAVTVLVTRIARRALARAAKGPAASPPPP